MQRKQQSEVMEQEEVILVNKRWKVLSACREFVPLLQGTDPDALDLFEKQITEYLNMTELSESYLKEVPRSVCWYEGLISTEMLLMEFLLDVEWEKFCKGEKNKWRKREASGKGKLPLFVWKGDS